MICTLCCSGYFFLSFQCFPLFPSTESFSESLRVFYLHSLEVPFFPFSFRRKPVWGGSFPPLPPFRNFRFIGLGVHPLFSRGRGSKVIPFSPFFYFIPLVAPFGAWTLLILRRPSFSSFTSLPWELFDVVWRRSLSFSTRCVFSSRDLLIPPPPQGGAGIPLNRDAWFWILPLPPPFGVDLSLSRPF